VTPQRLLRITALVGLALIAIVAPRTATMPALVLMVASGIAVPLGLGVALAPVPGKPAPFAHHLIRFAAPVGAAGGILGWLDAPGTPRAIAGAVAHALPCLVAGLLALERIWPMLRRRALDPLPELAIDVGLLFLPAAAIWLLASRAAMPLAGFQEPVVTFTAAHFHFAGFAAPIVLGGVGRLLGATTRLYRVATVAVCAGVPLTAIGIATNHTIEQISAVTVASGMLCASIVLVFFASRRASSTLGAALVVLSGASLLLTMALAATFALTSSAGRGSSLQGAVTVQTMIDFHGAMNAIAFACSALVALTLQQLRPSAR
jgi:hypothetical protein